MVVYTGMNLAISHAYNFAMSTAVRVGYRERSNFYHRVQRNQIVAYQRYAFIQKHYQQMNGAKENCKKHSKILVKPLYPWSFSEACHTCLSQTARGRMRAQSSLAARWDSLVGLAKPP